MAHAYLRLLEGNQTESPDARSISSERSGPAGSSPGDILVLDRTDGDASNFPQTIELTSSARCQACIADDRDCFIRESSSSGVVCSALKIDCLFTRFIERTASRDAFSWAEIAIRGHAEPIDHVEHPQNDLPPQNERADLSHPLDGRSTAMWSVQSASDGIQSDSPHVAKGIVHVDPSSPRLIPSR